MTGVGGTVVISTSAPSSADVGDLWWDSDDGDLLVYFNDGSGSQWVSTSAGATGAPVSYTHLTLPTILLV